MNIFKTDLNNPRTRQRYEMHQRKCHRIEKGVLVHDLFLLLQELGKNEYAQDQEAIDRLRKRYGWEL